MVRKVFFSFEYGDVWRANNVRKSWVTQGREAAGFQDAAEHEKLKRQGRIAIRNWIDKQLQGTSVTVVLVGAETCDSAWVRYEIEKSKQENKGLLGIDISGIEDSNERTSTCCGRIPEGYPFYDWVADDGYNNIGVWIEKAARKAGR